MTVPRTCALCLRDSRIQDSFRVQNLDRTVNVLVLSGCGEDVQPGEA